MEPETTQKVLQKVLRKMIDFWIEIKPQKAAKTAPGEGNHSAAYLHARPLYVVGVVKTQDSRKDEKKVDFLFLLNLPRIMGLHAGRGASWSHAQRSLLVAF